jgi:hypothetical protein
MLKEGSCNVRRRTIKKQGNGGRPSDLGHAFCLTCGAGILETGVGEYETSFISTGTPFASCVDLLTGRYKEVEWPAPPTTSEGPERHG